MAATSDDDAATTEDSDGDTTAAAVAKRVPKLPDGDDEEDDRTIRQRLDPESREVQPNPSFGGARSPVVPPPAIQMTSKKPTAVGLGAPPAVTRAAAGYDPTPAKPPAPPASKGTPPKGTPPKKAAPPIATQADAADDSVTATAPAHRITDSGAPLPITPPGDVKITEIVDPADEPFDETEVRTVVVAPSSALPTGSAPKPAPAPAPAAGAPAELSNEADEPDDSVTMQAPSPLGRVNDDDDLETSPPRLAPKPMPAAGRRPSDVRTAAAPAPVPDDDYAEESVTTRGPAVEYEDDSVTAQAPVAHHGAPAALRGPPAFGDRHPHAVIGPEPRSRLGSSPDVGVNRAASSVAAEAPSANHHLSNMLRVIGARSGDSENDTGDSDNHTAVMANAPVKPPGAATSAAARGSRGGRQVAAIADRREASSDGEFRIARARASSGDHAHPDLLHASVPRRDPSAPFFEPADRRAGNRFAKTEKAFNRRPAPSAASSSSRGVQPREQDGDFASTIKKPRYGLLVVAVALVSFAIPMVVFILLQSGLGPSDTPTRERAELQADKVARGDAPRSRAGSAAASAAASASAKRNDGWPRRR